MLTAQSRRFLRPVVRRVFTVGSGIPGEVDSSEIDRTRQMDAYIFKETDVVVEKAFNEPKAQAKFEVAAFVVTMKNINDRYWYDKYTEEKNQRILKENSDMQRLSHQAQRGALERFLTLVRHTIHQNQNLKMIVLTHLNALESNKTAGTEKEVMLAKKAATRRYNSLFVREYPSMSGLNEILTVEPIRAALWAHLGLSSQLPVFKASLWYGKLSEPIHDPDFCELYVAKHDTDVRSFFADLINLKILHEEAELVTYDQEMVDAWANISQVEKNIKKKLAGTDKANLLN